MSHSIQHQCDMIISFFSVKKRMGKFLLLKRVANVMTNQHTAKLKSTLTVHLFIFDFVLNQVTARHDGFSGSRGVCKRKHEYLHCNSKRACVTAAATRTVRRPENKISKICFQPKSCKLKHVTIKTTIYARTSHVNSVTTNCNSSSRRKRS